MKARLLIVLCLCLFCGCSTRTDSADVYVQLKAPWEVAAETVVVPEPEGVPIVEEPESAPIVEEPTYTEEELEVLAIIIYQEAGGDACNDSTRQMVGEVFLNRVSSPLFPDTFKEVATQKSQYGRLYWTGLVWPERRTSPGEAHAVERAYDTARALLEGSLERLLPEDVIFQAEFEQGNEIIVHQDGFYFCR